MATSRYVLDFSEIHLADVATVGGKNASLGEMFGALAPTGVRVLDGFATTSEAYRQFVTVNDLGQRLQSILGPFDPENLTP